VAPIMLVPRMHDERVRTGCEGRLTMQERLSLSRVAGWRGKALVSSDGLEVGMIRGRSTTTSRATDRAWGGSES
jgi:hypothetical protein